MSAKKQAAEVLQGLQVIGHLLGLAATVADGIKRTDISKPVREILEHFGSELRRVAESEAARAAEGDGRPPARSQ